eukprot:scaffold362709_cov46-Prasinocladus_malaysianus.AAC.1
MASLDSSGAHFSDPLHDRYMRDSREQIDDTSTSSRLRPIATMPVRGCHAPDSARALPHTTTCSSRAGLPLPVQKLRSAKPRPALSPGRPPRRPSIEESSTGSNLTSGWPPLSAATAPYTIHQTVLYFWMRETVRTLAAASTGSFHFCNTVISTVTSAACDTQGQMEPLRLPYSYRDAAGKCSSAMEAQCNLRFGSAEDIGCRRSMEDRIICEMDIMASLQEAHHGHKLPQHRAFFGNMNNGIAWCHESKQEDDDRIKGRKIPKTERPMKGCQDNQRRNTKNR